MKQKIDQNEFLEHAQVHKHYYGTSIEAVKAVAKKNMVRVFPLQFYRYID
jgi:guanylate kinase